MEVLNYTKYKLHSSKVKELAKEAKRCCGSKLKEANKDVRNNAMYIIN